MHNATAITTLSSNRSPNSRYIRLLIGVIFGDMKIHYTGSSSPPALNHKRKQMTHVTNTLKARVRNWSRCKLSVCCSNKDKDHDQTKTHIRSCCKTSNDTFCNEDYFLSQDGWCLEFKTFVGIFGCESTSECLTGSLRKGAK